MFNVPCAYFVGNFVVKFEFLIPRDKTFDLRTNLFNKQGCTVVYLSVSPCVSMCTCCDRSHMCCMLYVTLKAICSQNRLRTVIRGGQCRHGRIGRVMYML